MTLPRSTFPLSVAISSTKVLSILTSSTRSLSKSSKMLSDEYPEPKSSIENLKPYPCNDWTFLKRLPSSLVNALSVISSGIYLGSIPYSPAIFFKFSVNFSWYTCILDTLTDIGTGSIPLSSIILIQAHTLFHIKLSTSITYPFFSRTGMNWSGYIISLSFCHLTSASPPIICPLCISTLGCTYAFM